MKNDDITSLDFAKSDGLVPAVVQDEDTRAVLMVGYMNPEAVQKTVDTGRVTFFSRSRQCIWVKGETSGNFLQLISIKPDCDRDCLLVRARPSGPVCHTGSPTCFGQKDVGIIRALEALCESRNNVENSYIARLKSAGVQKIAQKIGEEGVETALALTNETSEAVRREAADLVFHLLVGLNARGLCFEDVLEELSARRSAPKNERGIHRHL